MEQCHTCENFNCCFFRIMAGCPSRSLPASRCSTAAAAVAAPNKSASLNELLAPALCSCVHLTSPNLWRDLTQMLLKCTHNNIYQPCSHDKQIFYLKFGRFGLVQSCTTKVSSTDTQQFHCC